MEIASKHERCSQGMRQSQRSEPALVDMLPSPEPVRCGGDGAGVQTDLSSSKHDPPLVFLSGEWESFSGCGLEAESERLARDSEHKKFIAMVTQQVAMETASLEKDPDPRTDCSPQ